MAVWHPRAHRAPADRKGGSFIGVAPKIVLHTVEGSGRYIYNPANYYGNPYWPHSTIDPAGIHQHLPIDVSAFALANSPGGVETGRADAIQCEVLWFAGRIGELPDATMRHLADWVSWVAEQRNVPLTFAEFSGDGAYGERAPQRFSAREWLDFTGICGHQHVPENDHWDPGAFPVERLRSLLGTSPVTSKEDTLFSPSPIASRHLIVMHSQLLMTAEPKKHGKVTQQASDGSLGQRWMVYGHDDGSMSFVVRDEKWKEGLALDVPDNDAKAGALLQVYPFDANPAQRFTIEGVAPGVGIVKPVSNPDVAVDLFFNGTDAGGEFGLYTRHGDLNQRLMGAPTV